MNLAEAPARLLPGIVQIEPAARCKLSARLSPAAQRAGARIAPPPSLMTFDRYCRLADALTPPLELRLQGEEDPLLHPRFFDMVAYAVQRGLDVSATTRLPGLSASRAEECVLSGLATLYVVAPEEPSGLVKRSLERLEEAKRRLGSARPEVRLLREPPPAAR